MEDVVAAKNWVADNATKEVLEQAFASGNGRGILLGLGLPLDGIICETLLGRNGWDDEHGIQPLEGLMEAQERRVSSPSRVGLPSANAP